METLTFGKANIPTDVYWLTITSRVQETSWNSTIFVVARERIFDDMNNGFGWNRLPKSFMDRILYSCLWQPHQKLLQSYYAEIENPWIWIACHQQNQDLCFQFISLPAKWIKTSRRHVLEHLLRQQCLCQPVQDRLWLKTMLLLVKPAYISFKSLYGVRGFCVCDISVVQATCTQNEFKSLCKKSH